MPPISFPYSLLPGGRRRPIWRYKRRRGRHNNRRRHASGLLFLSSFLGSPVRSPPCEALLPLGFDYRAPGRCATWIGLGPRADCHAVQGMVCERACIEIGCEARAFCCILCRTKAEAPQEHVMLRAEQNQFVTETGPGTPMGELFRRYWIPAMHAERAAGKRMPAGAGQAPVRAAAGLARHARPAGADRRVLRPPRRVAVVRPQRAERAALPLSRLEIRPHRPVHRGAVGAVRKRLLPARSS